MNRKKDNKFDYREEKKMNSYNEMIKILKDYYENPRLSKLKSNRDKKLS